MLDKVKNKLSGWKGKLLSLGDKLILIQSVIQDVPTYLLALIQPTKAIIKALCKLMLDFFWHDTTGQQKYHWIRWSKFCYPKEEGGVGLRSISDISKAFAVKLWRRFKQQNTLWAKYMKVIYSSMEHPATINVKNASNIWKRMLSIRHIAEPHVKWLVGRGKLMLPRISGTPLMFCQFLKLSS